MLTKETIIDNYGFDPSNYALLWDFTYCRKRNDLYDFYQVLSTKDTIYITLMVKHFHSGLFLYNQMSDLSYLYGNVANNPNSSLAERHFIPSQINPATKGKKCCILQHSIHNKCIVIPYGDYTQYFFPYNASSASLDGIEILSL